MRWKSASPIWTRRIEALNNTITAQWKQIDALSREMLSLRERLEDAEAKSGTVRRKRTPAALLKSAPPSQTARPTTTPAEELVFPARLCGPPHGNGEDNNA